MGKRKRKQEPEWSDEAKVKLAAFELSMAEYAKKNNEERAERVAVHTAMLAAFHKALGRKRFPKVGPSKGRGTKTVWPDEMTAPITILDGGERGTNWYFRVRHTYGDFDRPTPGGMGWREREPEVDREQIVIIGWSESHHSYTWRERSGCQLINAGLGLKPYHLDWLKRLVKGQRCGREYSKRICETQLKDFKKEVEEKGCYIAHVLPAKSPCCCVWKEVIYEAGSTELF